MKSPPTYQLRRSPTQGFVSEIRAPGVKEPIGFTRWDLDGWRVFSANGRQTSIRGPTERAVARRWADMIVGRAPRTPPPYVPPTQPVCGVDTLAFLRQVILLPTIQAHLPPYRRGKREANAVKLVLTSMPGTGCGGKWASTPRTVTLQIGEVCHPAALLEVIVHEVCHIPEPPTRGAYAPRKRVRWDSHGPAFRHLLRTCVRDLWGISVEDPADRGTHLNVAYALDARIHWALSALPTEDLWKPLRPPS